MIIMSKFPQGIQQDHSYPQTTSDFVEEFQHYFRNCFNSEIEVILGENKQ
jgi:hypothetical protein